MARKLVAEVVIKAVDHFSGPMKRIGRHMARSNKSFARAGAAARRAGRSLGVGVTMPAVAIGRSLFGAALEFDRMRNSAQAAGRLTNKQIKPVELLARKLGSTTQFTTSQAMCAARMLYKAGFDTERVMGMQEGTLNLGRRRRTGAADGGGDIATNVLTGMGTEMKTQEQATKSLTRVNDVLAYAALYQIHAEVELMKADTTSPVIKAVIGSVLNEQLVAHVIKEHKVQTIYHAAAYKHVPLVA